jgi:hypothetical protein
VTGLVESAIKDMSPATHEFFIDELPTQPIDEKQPHCPLRLVHNDYKIENTIAVEVSYTTAKAVVKLPFSINATITLGFL